MLVLGGIRSGKSQWAETAIAESAGDRAPVRYLATGAPPTTTPTGRRASPHTGRAGQRTGRRSKLSMWQRNCDPTPRRATLVDDIGGWLTAAMDRARRVDRRLGRAPMSTT